MHDRINARLEKIDVYYDAASTDVREDADEIIPWVEIYRLNDDDHFLRYIREHVEDEYRRRKQGDRAKPLCRCADSACPVKRGSIPPQIVPRRGGLDELEIGVEKRVESYVNGDHKDVVVAEALDQWVERYAAILPKLTRAVSLLEDDVESGRGLLEA